MMDFPGLAGFQHQSHLGAVAVAYQVMVNAGAASSAGWAPARHQRPESDRII